MSTTHASACLPAQPQLDFSAARVNLLGQQPDGSVVGRFIIPAPRLVDPGRELLRIGDCCADIGHQISRRSLQDAVKRGDLKGGRTRIKGRGIYLVPRAEWERYKRQLGLVG